MSKSKQYAESCDNESGSFLTHQLIAIRQKAYEQGSKDRKVELITRLHKQLEEAHEFMKKTNGTSDEKYDVDYWHDLGWEKDIKDYFKKYSH